MTDALVIFAREPVPGMVKTRLAAAIGAERSAMIYATLLDHTLRTVRKVPAEVTISLAATPGVGWADMLELPCEVQGGGDLGDRLAEAFDRRFSGDVDRAVIIGSDNAHLGPDHIATAFRALESQPVVLGPADDGGYWLVGQRSPGAEIFDEIPWSSPGTLDATRERLQRLDIQWSELTTLPDIDTVEDLKRAMADPRVPETLRAALASAADDSGPSRNDPEGPWRRF